MKRLTTAALALACACAAAPAVAGDAGRDRSFQELVHAATDERVWLDDPRDRRDAVREVLHAVLNERVLLDDPLGGREFGELRQAWIAAAVSTHAGPLGRGHGFGDWREVRGTLKDWGFEHGHGWQGHGWTDPHCIPAVPEPSALALMAGGLVMLGLRLRRGRKLP